MICRSLNTRVRLLNQFIKETEKMSYSAPIDETKFWLYEILEVQRLFSISNYRELKKEDFDLIHTLMGNDVKSRKDFIFENAINVSNLDI